MKAPELNMGEYTLARITEQIQNLDIRNPLWRDYFDAELWEILDYVTTTSYDTSTGQKRDKYINARLAALQGPQKQ